MIDIQVEDTQVLAALQSLADRGGDLSGIMAYIGEKMTESTKQRFQSGTGVDGEQWKQNSPLTLSKKSGSLPLTDSGILGSTIMSFVNGNELQVGSNMEYAAMQQFGGKKSEFAHLWGDIPARPFLGVSSSDQDMILTTIQDYLAAPLT